MNSNEPHAALRDRPAVSRRTRRRLCLYAPLLCAGLGTLPFVFGWLDQAEMHAIDQRFRKRGPLEPDPRIVIVEIDQASRDRLAEPGRVFKLREHLADAIDNIMECGAVTIGIDFWLAGVDDDETDAALAEVIVDEWIVLGATHSGGRSIRAAKLFRERSADDPDDPDRVIATEEGSISVVNDPDGCLRRVESYPHINYHAKDGTARLFVPHFPYALAKLMLQSVYDDADESVETPKTDFERHEYGIIVGQRVNYGGLINYAAGPGQGFKTVAFADVVVDDFDPDVFDGAAAIIGPTRSIEDQFSMPFSEELVPGVYYHANVLDEVLQDRQLREWPRTPRGVALLTFAVGVLCGWYFWNLRDWWKRRWGWVALGAYFSVGALVLAVGWYVICHRAFAARVVLPMMPPLAGLGVVMITGLAAQAALTVMNARRLAERNRHIEMLFGRSVSPQMLDAIKSDPSRITGVEVRDVSVLFCDIRGFTATSTKLTPEQVADMLNEYFEAITAAVFAYDGFIDKFVGDELMAVFGVPMDQQDHALRAAMTGVGIKRQLGALNEKRLARGQNALDCGVGIHTGPAAAGYIGAGRRANYTVVGDTVNIAARIEGLTARGEILISDALRKRLPDSIPLKPWKTVELKGSDRPHELSELIAGHP